MAQPDPAAARPGTTARTGTTPAEAGDLLIEESSRKAAVTWIRAAGGPATAAWCLPQGGALYVITGPGEQSVPGLAAGADTVVTLRGDHGGAVVEYQATVERVSPDSDDWGRVAIAVAGKRLNASGTSDELAERWARECTLFRLSPAGPPLAAGDGSQAARPRPSQAANAVRKPFRLHRVRRAA